MKKKMYISLPITGRQLDEVREYAENMKQHWEKLRYDVITPFDVSPDPDKPYSFHMGKCIEALLECDEVYFCLGWQRSKGCMAEFEIARIYGKEILIG